MSSPSIRMLPEVGVSKPASMRSNVVLPEPEPPSRQKISPSPDVERHVVDGDEVAELLGEVYDANVGRGIGGGGRNGCAQLADLREL